MAALMESQPLPTKRFPEHVVHLFHGRTNRIHKVTDTESQSHQTQWSVQLYIRAYQGTPLTHDTQNGSEVTSAHLYPNRPSVLMAPNRFSKDDELAAAHLILEPVGAPSTLTLILTSTPGRTCDLCAHLACGHLSLALHQP